MNAVFDLHCHSTASDGALTPTELVHRAGEQGVTTLSLTDHDTTAGLAEAQHSAKSVDIDLIPGIELSASWNHQCIHIVGLDIDPQFPPLCKGIDALQSLRIERAEKIAGKLENKKITGALESVKRSAGKGMITRTHFAEFLLSHNHVSTLQEAFDRYLSRGKPAFVSTDWTATEDAVSWIRDSGGVAVLAHPLRYKLTASKMKRMLAEFKEMGGQGIEVVTGRSTPDEIRVSANYAKSFELSGSVGSDFHNPKNPWVELGRLAPLPFGISPVWELLAS